MGLVEDTIQKAKERPFLKRELDRLLYEAVAEELDNGDIKRGLWIKSLAETDGDEQRARAKYISLRVESLFDEIRTEQQHTEKLEAAKNHQRRADVQNRVNKQGLVWRSSLWGAFCGAVAGILSSNSFSVPWSDAAIGSGFMGVMLGYLAGLWRRESAVFKGLNDSREP